MNKIDQINKIYRLMLGRDHNLNGRDLLLLMRQDPAQIQFQVFNSQEFKNRFKFSAVEPTPLVNDLPIYIVNLERRPDRKTQIGKRLTDLGIQNYQFIKAVDGQQLTDQDMENHYDDRRSREIHRPMTPSEVACALSHIEIARKIINEDLDYAVILEDDAQPTLQFKQFLKEFDLKKNYGFDFLILGAFSSNQFFNGKVKTKTAPFTLIEKESIIYLDKIKYRIGPTTIHDTHYPTKQLDYVHGTHAYIMSKEGAKKLLEINYPIIVEADNVWNYFNDRCCIEFTNPILCHRQHLDSDIHDERIDLVTDDRNFFNSFLARKNHPDFGT